MKDSVLYTSSFQKLFEFIQQSGKDSLHVVADFDRTLTQSFVNGKETPSLISVLRSEGILGDTYSQEAYKLYDYYHPIEIDPEIDAVTRKEKMTQWWESHMQLLINTGISRHHIDDALKKGIIELRDGVSEFLGFLNHHDIPLVIISANALGTDSIKDYLIHKDLYNDNIHIISNGFIWDETGKSKEYIQPVIHSFNKDETVLQNYPKIHSITESRKNVILLGDSIGDPGMVEGCDTDTVLKIGFLNKNIEENRELYTTIYDMVVLNDGTFHEINTLLEEL